jgi:hypothetical protein
MLAIATPGYSASGATFRACVEEKEEEEEEVIKNRQLAVENPSS